METDERRANDAIRRVKALVQQGKSRSEIMNLEQESYVRNMQFVHDYQEHMERKLTRPTRHVDVHVLWGDVDVGRTKCVVDHGAKLFTVNLDNTFRFDSYDGEGTIFIDDFRGNIEYSAFLRILGGHQHCVNSGYGYRYAKWTKIFITSSAPPSEWYTEGLTPNLSRRLTTIEYIGTTTPCKEMNRLLCVSDTVSGSATQVI